MPACTLLYMRDGRRSPDCCMREGCARRAAQAEPAALHAAAASPQATVQQRAQRVLRLLGIDAPGSSRGAHAPAVTGSASAPNLAGDLLGGDLLGEAPFAADNPKSNSINMSATAPRASGGEAALLGGLAELSAPALAELTSSATDSLFAGMALAPAAGTAAAAAGPVSGQLESNVLVSADPFAVSLGACGGAAPASAAHGAITPLFGAAARADLGLFGGLAVGGGGGIGSSSAPDLAAAGGPSRSLDAALFGGAPAAHVASVRHTACYTSH